MNTQIVKLSYPCIFSKSPEEAAQNLYRLISRKECGFDEGCDVWKTVIETMLENRLDIQSLNYHRTDFSEEWWTTALDKLLAKISTPATE